MTGTDTNMYEHGHGLGHGRIGTWTQAGTGTWTQAGTGTWTQAGTGTWTQAGT
jgi:hypothetical protein